MSTQRQFLLGIFFLTAISILAFYTLFLTDFTLFSEPLTMDVYFSEANGLREGDAVMIQGLRVGRVKTLTYDSSQPADRRIKAVLNLNEEIELLENARISIQESTLLGGRQIDIDPGTFGGPPLTIAEGEVLKGVVQRNPIQALSSIGDILTENREAVRNIVRGLDTIVADARAGRGPLGRLLYDEEMARDLSSTVSSISEVAANSRRITDDINAGRGVIGRLINDEDLLETVRGTVMNLQTISADLREGRGIAGRLIYDEALADEVARAFQSFSNVAQKIERGEGIAGKLLSDPALGAKVESILGDFQTAAADIRAVVAQFRSGGGTLGRLLMDQQLYDEALVAVRLLTRSLEDYREAAPITAFTGVLFSAF